MNKSESVVKDFIVDWFDPIDGLRTAYGVVGTLTEVVERFSGKGEVVGVFDSYGEVWRPAPRPRMG